MTNSHLSIAVIIIVLTVSCVKESSKQIEPNQTQLKPTDDTQLLTGPNGSNSTKAYITTQADRPYHDPQYVCSYSGFDFDFGYSFPYPTTIQSYQTGQSYIPSLGYVSIGPNPLLEFRMGADGSSFTALLSTIRTSVPSNARQSLDKYYEAFDSFVTQEIDSTTGGFKQSTLPNYETFASKYNYSTSADGLITVKGKFILDYNSPTHVSLISINYANLLPVE